MIRIEHRNVTLFVTHDQHAVDTRLTHIYGFYPIPSKIDHNLSIDKSFDPFREKHFTKWRELDIIYTYVLLQIYTNTIIICSKFFRVYSRESILLILILT